MNKLLDYALEYCARGWGVIPLAKTTKRPLVDEWSPYKTRKPTEDEIKEWWTKWPDANIGVICGKFYGIFILDIDGEEGRKFLEGKHMPTTTPCTKTGKGWHYILKYPGTLEIRNSASDLAPHVDVRGEGGYFVAPPSIHANGSEYTWLIEDHPTDAPKWLIDAILSNQNGKHEPNQPGWATKLLLEGVKEGARDSSFTSLVGHWSRIGVEKDEQVALLRLFNARCDPPEPDKDFDDLVNRIYEKHTVSKSDPVPKEWVTKASSLLMEPLIPTKWLIDTLWVDQSCGFIAGAPKACKTWVAFEMAVSIVTGEPMFGHFKVSDPGIILYVAEEGNPEQLRSRLHKIATAKNIQVDSLDNFYIAIQKNFFIDNKSWQTAVHDFCAKFHPKAVFFDPLVRIHSAKENVADEMRKVLQQFRLIQINHKCSVVIVHHQKKPTIDAMGGKGNSLRGSGDLYAWLDSAIFLEKKSDESDKIGVDVLHRDFGDIEPFKIISSITDDEALMEYAEGTLEDEKAMALACDFEKVILNCKDEYIKNSMLVASITANGKLKSIALKKLAAFIGIERCADVPVPDKNGNLRKQIIWRKKASEKEEIYG